MNARTRIALVVLLIAVVVLAIWIGRSIVFGSAPSEDSAATDHQPYDNIRGPTGRAYTEDNLQLLEAVRQQFRSVRPWVDPYTPEEELSRIEDELEEFHQMKGHERERQFFEMQVESVISSAIDNLSSDLDLYEGTLALSFHQSVDECAAEHGIENGNDLITALDWGAIEPRIANDSDYELDNLLQLRHDCAVHASSYPTLSEALRNDLISRTESALLESVLKWTREHPELVVPMEYHTGANHPYADQLAEACRGSSNPSACAENAGIDLESDTPDNGQNRGE